MCKTLSPPSKQFTANTYPTSLCETYKLPLWNSAPWEISFSKFHITQIFLEIMYTGWEMKQEDILSTMYDLISSNK